ncbi:MAG: DEAD/DEAH RNA helicase [Candidatus Daviesbacteria bacterium GW2011_GWB1_39_5]|nr:MAG: DEAD/DEAH RNA helicase [Candidatus Daviesbacteria bacterium GW2011_GWB1_39_5]
MYNNSRYRQRTSIRHNGFSNGFSRSPQRGSFARPGFSANKRGGGQRRSQLEGADINMFIRKAAQNAPDESQTDINPTPVQAQAIGPILEGRDVIGLASTGTGKTAAFLIPLIQKIYLNRDQKALIIVPTRELALQINEEFKNLTRNMKLFSAFIIGGTNMYRQIQDLRRNPHIVIATPGRLKDLIERKNIYMEDYSNIVLDEVDLMVDIGFINDIKFFVSRMPKVRQSLFFSATISPKIQDVLRYFVTNPVTVSVKTQDTSENVEQDVVKVENPEKKIDTLHDLLIKDGFDKVLIFGRTKHGIEKLNKELEFRGFKVGSIHGNKRQSQRMRVLQSFKQNQIQILLATDVASRGLDIDNVTHVINYDLPQTYDDYIHRIGRTGRAGKTGIALTFVGNSYVNR